MPFIIDVKREVFGHFSALKKSASAFRAGFALCLTFGAGQKTTFVVEWDFHSKLYTTVATAALGERPLYTLTEDEPPRYKFSIPLSKQRLIADYYGDDPYAVVNDDSAAFLAGAFLACGHMSSPQKGYRLEFSPPDEETADILFFILSSLDFPPKSTTRRGKTVIYTKDSEAIEGILTVMGAKLSAIQLMEEKIFKDLRNHSNRVSNCDTANIDKTIAAASHHVECIQRIIEADIFDNLSAELKEIARFRLDNPDMSLREIASALGISRSGVNHRLKRLSDIAENITKDEGI